MSTHPRRRLALALAIAGTLAGGALAGPAMAAGDDTESPGLTPRKAGGSQQQLLTMRKAGGDPGTGYIIAIL